MTRSIAPLVLRTDFFSPEAQSTLVRFFTQASVLPVQAVTVNLILDGESQEFYLTDPVRIAVKPDDWDHAVMMKLAEFRAALEDPESPMHMQLSDCETAHEAIRRSLDDVTAQVILGMGISEALGTINPLGSFPQVGSISFYTLWIAPNCAILSSADPKTCMADREDDLLDTPDCIGLRAPICTIILPRPDSHHALLERSDTVITEHRIWMQRTGMSRRRATARVKLALVTAEDIVTASSSSIDYSPSGHK